MAPESFIYSLVPELRGIDPQRIWDSEVTHGYPAYLQVGGFNLGGLTEANEALGDNLRALGLIPQSGAILDLGTGPCSELVFGQQVVRDRVWGVDYALGQIGRSQIPSKRQIVADLREAGWIGKLKGQQFALATSLLLAKYLSIAEAESLYAQVRNIAPRLVIAEYYSVSEGLETLLGQSRTFMLEVEKMLLEEAGWHHVQDRVLEVEVGQVKDRHRIGLVWGQAEA